MMYRDGRYVTRQGRKVIIIDKLTMVNSDRIDGQRQK